MNVVVLLLDALRYDYVDKETTPNLIRIAQDGLFYSNCQAGNTATLKSMPILLCGEPKYLSGVSIMQKLKPHGYNSVLLHTNALVEREFKNGWDHTIDLHSFKGYSKRKIRRLMRKYVPTSLFQIIRGIHRNMASEYLPYARAEIMLGRAFELLQNLPNPYFLWIHLMDPHLPYYPQKTSLAKDYVIKLNDKLLDAVHERVSLSKDEITELKNLYQCEIKEMDTAIGKFYDSINWTDKTLVITSDHGEEFGEQGQYSHHEDKYIPELQHVPLIIVGDGKGTIDEEFNHRDLYEYIVSVGIPT